jgi:two-component sensor histidine kinase
MPDVSEAAEARHRMANTFQLISTLMRMRIQRAEDEETRRQLTWMLDAVAALGLLSRRGPGNHPGDFAAVLYELVPMWRRRCEGRPVRIEIEAEALMVQERDESALALIAHELVSNALSHAFQDRVGGLVRVTLRPGETGRGELAVTDDGCGYDPQTATKTRLGLWLIAGLASQVQATLTTRTDDGVEVRLNFPLPTAQDQPAAEP